jgi:hypothetical protein
MELVRMLKATEAEELATSKAQAETEFNALKEALKKLRGESCFGQSS